MFNLLRTKMQSLPTKIFQKPIPTGAGFTNSTEASYSELVIIAGPPRSGTTWLNRELCNLNNTFNLLPESTFLTKQVESFNHILNYSDPERFKSYFYSKENIINYYKENVIRMLALVAEINKKQGDETLILKDPELSLYLNDAKALFPTHKLILLIRDPRDVLASMKNVMARKREAWNLEHTSAQIFLYYAKIAEYQKCMPENTLLVRYEDLITKGLGEVQNFLQKSAQENVSKRDIAASIHKNFSSSDPFFSEFYLQQTTKDLIGRYKETLLESEISYIEKVYSGVMSRWDY